MSFDKHLAGSRRLALLRFLVEMDGEANESVIETGLKALNFKGKSLGEGVRADLLFLEQRGLVVSTYYDDRIMGGAITKRGEAYLAREVPQIDGVDYPKVGR